MVQCPEGKLNVCKEFLSLNSRKSEQWERRVKAAGARSWSAIPRPLNLGISFFRPQVTEQWFHMETAPRCVLFVLYFWRGGGGVRRGIYHRENVKIESQIWGFSWETGRSVNKGLTPFLGSWGQGPPFARCKGGTVLPCISDSPQDINVLQA